MTKHSSRHSFLPLAHGQTFVVPVLTPIEPFHSRPETAPTASTWNGAAGDGNWQTARNWVGMGLPNSTSAVTLNNGTTNITYAGTTAIYSLNAITDALTIGGGTLTITNTSTFTSALTIGGGQLSLGGASSIKTLSFTSTGTLDVAAGKTATLATSSFGNGGNISDTGTVATTGTTTVLDNGTNPSIVLGNGATWMNTGVLNDAGMIGFGLSNSGNNDGTSATITNAGTFNFTADDGTIAFTGAAAGGFAGVLNNTGLLQKTAGSLTRVGVAVNNTGTINVSTGTLELDVANSLNGTVLGTGTLALGAVAFAVGNVVGSGTIGVAAGTLTASAGTTGSIAAHLKFTGGQIAGPGTLSTSSITTVVDEQASGGTTGTLALSIGDGGIWTNTGVVVDNGRIGYGLSNSGNNDSTSGTINNAGTFNLAGDDGDINNSGAEAGGFAGLFDNTGRLAKSSGNGTSYIQVPLNNEGTIVVSTGTLELDGGGTLAGTASGPGVLTLGGGDFAVTGLNETGTLVVSGSGTLALAMNQTGTLSGTGSTSFISDSEIAIDQGAIQTLAGTTSFNGGQIAGPGTVVTTGATAIVDASSGSGPAGPVSLAIGNSGIWTNTGVVTDAGRIGYGLSNSGNNDGTSGTINNAGTFNLSTDDGNVTNSGAEMGGFAAVFNNSGLLAKTGGTGTSYIQVGLNNTGTINVASGTLELDVTTTLGGTVNGSGTLALGNTVFAVGSVVGTGTIAVAAGTLTAAGTGKIGTHLVFDGGQIASPGTVTTTGATTIVDGQSGGGLSGPVSFAIGNNGVWTNTGTVSDAGRIGFGLSNGGNNDGTSGTINNANVFNLTGDDGDINNLGASGGFVGLFSNTGTLAKTGGSGTSYIQVAVSNTGTINVATGTLEFDGGGTLAGSAGGAGVLVLGGGNFATTGLNETGKLMVSGSGTLALAAKQTGTVSGTGSITFVNGGEVVVGTGGAQTVAGTASFNNGQIAGPGTFTTSGATTIVDEQSGGGLSAPVALAIGDSGIWTNTGVVTDAGRIGYGLSNSGNNDGTSGTINNAGTFDLSSDDGDVNNFGAEGAFTGIFNNSGLLAKTGGTGISYIQETLNSTGTISASTGMLELDSGGSLSGVIAGTATVVLGGGSFAAKSLNVSGNLAISGSGTLAVAAKQIGTVSGAGSIAVINGGEVATGTGGTQTIAGPASFSGGQIAGPGIFATSGATTIADQQTGGGLSAPVALAIGNSGIWTNTGVVTDAGRIGYGLANQGNNDGTSGTINNAGTFDLSSDDGDVNNFGATGGFAAVFSNSGLLAKTGGTGTSYIQETLNSTGTLSASTGTLEADNGGSIAGSIAGTATVLLGGGSFAASGLTVTGNLAISGSGTLALVAKQTAIFTGASSLVLINGGEVASGAGSTQTVGGTANFNGGQIAGPGTFATSGATTIVDVQSGGGLSAPAAVSVGNGAVWTNTGVVNDAGRIGYGLPNSGNNDGTSGTINNAGTFNFTTSDGDINNAYAQGNFVGVFNNSGTLAKTGGTGTSYIQETFNSTGSITASVGTLELDNGGTLGGTIAASKTGVVLAAASASFVATQLTIGDNAAAAAFTVAGTLTNASTVTLAGKLSLTGSAQLTNAKAGTVLLTTADATIAGVGTGYAASNAGLIRDSFSGTGALAVVLTNTGTIDAATGTLKLANVSGTGKLLIEAGATLDIGLAVATTQAIAFAGAAGATLKQDHPASVTTAMAGFGAGDQIDLAGLTATAATISGSTLSVTAGGGKTYTYAAASSLAGLAPIISSDGNGGSLVSLYRAASASFTPATLAFGNVHVGDTETLALSVTNTSPADGYSESLDASLVALPAGIVANGSISNLGAGMTNPINVMLAAPAAGSLTATGTLTLSTDGKGVDGRGANSLPSQSVAITGGVYRLAAPSLSTTMIDVGVVHVNDTVSQGVTITNAVTADGFSESLDASGTASGGALTSGSISQLTAGSASSAITVGLVTTSSGVVTGNVALGLISDGTKIDGLGTTTLSGQAIKITGTVDNYAIAGFQDPGGPAITAGSAANTYAINLGTLSLGGAGTSLMLGAMNNASGLSDLLFGTIAASNGGSSTNGFTTSGFGTFSGLGSGQGEHNQGVTLSAATAGSFTETVTVTAHGTNASGFTGVVQTETLVISGTVAAQGGTYTLVQGPNSITGAAGNDVFIAASGALNSRDSLTGSTGYSNTLQLTGAGLFDIDAPKTFANIQTILASEGQVASGQTPDTTQTLLLRDGTTDTVNVASGTAATGNANPETITIYGADNQDTINLGNGNDTVYVGGANETVNGGTGVDTFYSTAAAAGATIAGGGKGILHIDGGGAFTMGSSVTGLTSIVLDAASGNTQLVANTIAGLAITGSGGADTITLGAASQTVNAEGGAIHVLATAGNATAAITGATGAVLEITNAGNTVLNAADSNLIVQLDVAGKLSLGKASFVSAVGSGGADTLTAGAAGQVLTGGLGADMLIGAASFGDTFLDTAAGLDGDSITNFGGSDVIHLSDLMFGALTESYSGNTTKGVLTLSDGTHHAAITLVGNFNNGSFTFNGDATGGTMIGHI